MFAAVTAFKRRVIFLPLSFTLAAFFGHPTSPVNWLTASLETGGF